MLLFGFWYELCVMDDGWDDGNDDDVFRGGFSSFVETEIHRCDVRTII